jgi:hypothetical protein
MTMRYSNQDIGADASAEVGELYEDLSGNLYEWVEGYERVDGIDEYGECARCVGDDQSALAGLGALYAAPDGTVYQVQGLSAEEAENSAEPSADSAAQENESTRALGPGRPGQIRVGRDGKRYRWVSGKNAAGKVVGFWRRLPPGRPMNRPMPRPMSRMQRPGARGRGIAGPPSGPRRKKGGGFLRKLLPIAKLASQFIPIPGAGAAVRAGLTVASKLMKPRGVEGLGALYAAPDGTVYQMQGEDELGIVAGIDEMNDFAAVDEPEVLSDDVDGFGEEAALSGLMADGPESLSDPDQVQGVDGYMREQPPRTRLFAEPSEPPALWKPLW